MPRRLDEASEQRRAERRGLCREWLRQRKSPSATNDGVYASREAAACEHVLDEPAQPLPAGKPPEHRVAAREREGDVGEPKARDLLDQVDLPRHIARAPRRHEEPALQVAVEAEAVQDRRLFVRGDSSPSTASVRSVRSVIDCRSGSVPWTSASPVQRAPASSTMSRVASVAAGPATYGSTPFSQRLDALTAQRVPLGALEDPDRLEVRGFEQHATSSLR